jgi:hypothetical protein
MIEGRKHPSEVVRFGVRSGGGGKQPNVGRDPGQRREECYRLETWISIVSNVALKGIPHADMICDEQSIEFGSFGCRGKFLKIGDVIYLEIRRSWVTPRHSMISLRVEEESAENHRRMSAEFQLSSQGLIRRLAM